MAIGGAIAPVAADTVIDLMAVALVVLIGGAKAPDGVLHKAWKIGREHRVEAARVDLGGDTIQDLSTAARAIASGSVGMRCTEAAEDAGAAEEIVNQRVDRDQHAAGFDPQRASAIAGEQQRGQGHRRDLIGNPGDLDNRLQ